MTDIRSDLPEPIRRWHRAVNDRDLEVAAAAVTDDVVVGGPQGLASGRQLFLDWIERAGITLQPVAWHPVSGCSVVVEQDASWRTAAGESTPPQRLATAFRLVEGRVAAVVRCEDVAGARAAAEGLESSTQSS